MATNLVIRDGDPHWWNSPDIWVVPGDDPNGAPGTPVAGNPAYLWARAHNTGDQAIDGGRVNFYWSNPATGVLRSNSHFVGSAFVDLEPGETKEVLCVIPWIPQIVNEGHECLIAEIIHAADPLPVPLPDPFDPPSYEQVAQKNLNVLETRSFMVTKVIQVAAPKRTGQKLILFAQIGGKIDDLSLAQIGLKGYREGKPQKGLSVRLSTEGGCNDEGYERVEFALKPGQAAAAHLKVSPGTVEPRQYVAIHVIAKERDREVGGITYLLVNRKEG